MKTYSVFALVAVVCLGYAFPQAPSMKQYLNMQEDFIDSGEHGQNEGTRSTNCSCGYTNKARIVGGKETLKNEYPLIVGIKKKNNVEKTTANIFCGGSIITPRHVLTAAHCPEEFPGEPLVVVVGEHDQTVDSQISGAEEIDVEISIVHEKYDPDTFHYDIALFLLSKSLQFNQKVGPACLPNQRTNLINEYVKVLGWGRLYTNGPVSEVLLKVNLRVIPITVCSENYIREIPTNNPHQICTFLRSKDSCQGDSGGPVIWLDPQTNRYTLVALVSYGKKCGLKSPSVNTDVSYFLDWIQLKISETDSSVHTCARV